MAMKGETSESLFLCTPPPPPLHFDNLPNEFLVPLPFWAEEFVANPVDLRKPQQSTSNTSRVTAISLHV